MSGQSVNYIGLSQPNMEILFNKAQFILNRLQDKKKPIEIDDYVNELHEEYVDENYDEDNDGYNTEPDEEIKEIE